MFFALHVTIHHLLTIDGHAAGFASKHFCWRFSVFVTTGLLEMFLADQMGVHRGLSVHSDLTNVARQLLLRRSSLSLGDLTDLLSVLLSISMSFEDGCYKREMEKEEMKRAGEEDNETSGTCG